MGRNILGAIAGVVAGFAAIFLCQMIVNQLYPLPADVDVMDKRQMADVFRSLPAGHFAAILVTYLVGGFAGAAVTRLIAPSRNAAWVAPVLLALAAAANVLTYPHPVWAQIGGVLAPLLGGWLAMRMVRPRAPAATETSDAAL